MQAAKQSMKAGGDSRMTESAKIVGVESVIEVANQAVTGDQMARFDSLVKDWEWSLAHAKGETRDASRKFYMREAARCRAEIVRRMKAIEAGVRGA